MVSGNPSFGMIDGSELVQLTDSSDTRWQVLFYPNRQVGGCGLLDTPVSTDNMDRSVS